MFNKVELIAGLLGVLTLVVAFTLLMDRADLVQVNNSQLAAVAESGEANQNQERMSETPNELIKNDVVVGSGPEVKEGDTVTVHYVGTLQNGQEFDSSKKRGEPFSFTVGEGRVIKGWEQGLIGMQVGGERVLIIPPELAYGERGIGPIPGGATLTFMIELLAIDNG